MLAAVSGGYVRATLINQEEMRVQGFSNRSCQPQYSNLHSPGKPLNQSVPRNCSSPCRDLLGQSVGGYLEGGR